MIDDLKGRRILVTGSSTGIGAAVAVGYARLGAAVAVHYNASREQAEAVAAHIKAAGGVCHLVGGDVSKSAEATRVVDEAAEKLGGLDVLVNNAGALVKRVPLDQIDDDTYDAVLDLNVRSVVMASQAAARHMREAGRGSIINTSSVAARNGGGPGALLYAGAKAFVLNATRNLAKELAGSKIRVNGVSPGVISTPFHERYSTPEILENMRKTIPMAYIGEPEECVGAYVFFASDKMSGYITGQVLEVNGGQFMA
ncbi:SDR family NAD(P)-dependent oxidoreductase [Achromobacter marplatensis]|jgi:3-oxoacyl-[acyl-carrier protein] reductase|uniref:SDR family NAD(P)-dependent oxidoreductase n=1 Tax=Achromobacter marplatensis TaxID=470868 RepID=UPI000278211B|nr:dehydrogenase/reductase [Achromobacter marplatensis]